MALKAPTLYLICGPASVAHSVLIESVRNEFGVEVITIEEVNVRRGYASGDPRIDQTILDEAIEVIIFEIITAAMTDQSIAIVDVSGDQARLDRYIAHAEGAGMKVEVLTS